MRCLKNQITYAKLTWHGKIRSSIKKYFFQYNDILLFLSIFPNSIFALVVYMLQLNPSKRIDSKTKHSNKHSVLIFFTS